MKTLMNLVMLTALSASSLVLQAGEGGSDLDLAGCRAELRAYFGEDAQFNLVDRRRNAHGTRVRVAAKLDEDNAYFATCWVPKNDIAAYEEGRARPMLAVNPSTGIDN